MEILPTGKINLELLSNLIEDYCTTDETIVVGPKVGEDAAVIDLRDKYLIAKTDPITFVTDEIGIYAIHINANDIACMGGVPKWFLANVILPEKQTTKILVDDIFSQISDACSKLNISYCGGHTEITTGIDRPIVVGCMLGEVEKDKLITSAGAEINDHIILTKGIAIEAVSIIAREREAEILETYSDEFIAQCKNFVYDPGISVLPEVRIAQRIGGVHALHDPTEGGLAMGLWELATAAQVGMSIEFDKVRILPEAKLLCEQFDLDPLGVIASGAVLMTVEKAKSSKIVEALKATNIEAEVIGKILDADRGVKILINNDYYDLPKFDRDEILKIF
ncbi:MAG: AIR synthase family protein [bacterium]